MVKPSVLRIASLVPSLTELVFELGLGDSLVARTGFCIHPPDAAALPKVGGTKTVNLARLRQLAPTHVLVNVDENEKPTVDALRDFVPEVMVTHPFTPADNLGLIDQVVAVFGPGCGDPQALQERAAELKAKLRLGLAAFQGGDADTRLSGVTERARPVRALYLIWREPWMTVARDTYISQMLALANWQSLPAVEGGDGLATPGASRYPVVRGDEHWLSDVDVVLLSSEPYRFAEAHRADAQALCPQATVAMIDGEMMSWYGARAITGLAYWRAFSAAFSNPDPLRPPR